GDSKFNLMKNFGIQFIEEAFLVSVFCYEKAPLCSLLEAWARSDVPVHVLLPEGQLIHQVRSWFGFNPELKQTISRGNLHLSVIPFMSQDKYDQLLWISDVNFVRGEDSFVRAQWSANPLIWHIYPQSDLAHMNKLMAFFDRYSVRMPPELAEPLRLFWINWNTCGDVGLMWDLLADRMKLWKSHSLDWMTQLDRYPDLASNLVKFCENR
ncbi:MAG: elongation factor P maturation arginine rhamnosyltransferase EarP, partial [Pseudomonadota bacterium]|nr:elongation factor P maturation arginine rhamnosyltransferase EarP [Pseudomonadota bacterium]